MKKLLILSFSLFVSVSMIGQRSNKEFSNIFNKYQKTEGVESISFSPSAYINISIEKRSEEDIKYMSHIKTLIILIFNTKKFNSEELNNINKDIERYITNKKLQNIMTTTLDDTQVNIYSSNKEVFMISKEDNSINVVFLEGDITSDILKGVLSGKIGMFYTDDDIEINQTFK
ncbi:MAG: DUF4252 domain-containing protein [Bacteroidales bacterium]